MEPVRSFKELIVWQKAMDLTVACYEMTRQFPRQETFALSNQMQRSAVSIPANIAEGQARQHTGEFKHFLSIAAGSLAETETHIIIAIRLGYVAEQNSETILALCAEVGKLLTGLQKALRAKTDH